MPIGITNITGASKKRQYWEKYLLQVFSFIIKDIVHNHSVIFNKVLLLRAGEGGMRTLSRQKGECTEKGWEPLF